MKTARPVTVWPLGRRILLPILAAFLLPLSLAAQQRQAPASSPASAARSFQGQTTQDYNARIQQLLGQNGVANFNSSLGDYRIGPEDLLEISVMEAPDLDRTVRVSEDGKISLPLLGTVHAAGLTSRQLQDVLEYLLSRSYMKNPHVSVFVQEMRSHPVSVFGAVEKPGVFQIRQAKTLIEVLSMAQGLATDAGDTVIVMHHPGDPGVAGPAASLHPVSAGTTDPQSAAASPQSSAASTSTNDPADGMSVKISLKKLLNSGDPRYNVLVYPGDVVKVTRAGIVYVVGQVRRPGGFLLKTNENISVLQALALAEGLSPTAAAKNARIIEPGASIGTRKMVAVNLEKILKGKSPDLMLESQAILFVPDSKGKALLHGFVQSMGGIASAVSGAAVYRY